MFGYFPGLLRHVGWRTDVAWQIGQILRRIHAEGDGLTQPDGRFQGGGVSFQAGKRQFVQTAWLVILLLFEWIKPVGRRLKQFNGLANRPPGVITGDDSLMQQTDRLPGPTLMSDAGGSSECLAITGRIQFILFAETNQQNPLTGKSRQMIDEQHIARFSFKTVPLE